MTALMHNKERNEENRVDTEPQFWVRDDEAYRLWFEFLAISPSYEIARKYRDGSLSLEEAQALVGDFDRVLAVYDDLGDVQRIPFKTWFKSAIKQFGLPGTTPVVRNLGLVEPIKKDGASAPEYDKVQLSELQPPTDQPSWLFAIPTNATRSMILKQIDAGLKLLAQAAAGQSRPSAAYTLVSKRLRSNNLNTYLQLVRIRSEFQKEPLYDTALRTGLSPKYANVLGAAGTVQKTVRNTEARRALTSLTIRALGRTGLIAENAARGVFASYEECADALSLDLDFIKKHKDERIRNGQIERGRTQVERLKMPLKLRLRLWISDRIWSLVDWISQLSER